MTRHPKPDPFSQPPQAGQPTPPWKPSKWLIPVVAVVVLGIIGSIAGKKDDGANPDTEAMRQRWNAMSTSDRALTCAAVHDSGASATGYALGWPENHSDVVWFLTELACD